MRAFISEILPAIFILETLFANPSLSCISVVAMTGAVIGIENATAADTILSVKQRVYAANNELPVRRQRLVYRPGPHGMDALADDETLGGAGVVRDGTAELDVLIEPLTEEELKARGQKVLLHLSIFFSIFSLFFYELLTHFLASLVWRTTPHHSFVCHPFN